LFVLASSSEDEEIDPAMVRQMAVLNVRKKVQVCMYPWQVRQNIAKLF